MDEKRARFDAEILPHLDAAYRFARWLSRSSVDADDVLQEAILRAFRGFDGWRGGDAKSWLLTIVRNCHATALAQRQRRNQVPFAEERSARDGHSAVGAAHAPDPESELIDNDQERALQRLLGKLPEDHREVLVLREIEDLGYREIASVINAPIGTVMSRLARARAALKALWLSEMEGEPRAVR
jgi:RNA polymerase sigma-70 factor (ECF subfamily)